MTTEKIRTASLVYLELYLAASGDLDVVSTSRYEQYAYKRFPELNDAYQMMRHGLLFITDNKPVFNINKIKERIVYHIDNFGVYTEFNYFDKLYCFKKPTDKNLTILAKRIAKNAYKKSYFRKQIHFMTQRIITSDISLIQKWLCCSNMGPADWWDGFDTFNVDKVYIYNLPHLEKIIQNGEIVIDFENLDWLKDLIFNHIKNFGFVNIDNDRHYAYEHDCEYYYFKVPSDHNLNILTKRMAKKMKEQAKELLAEKKFLNLTRDNFPKRDTTSNTQEQTNG